METAIVQTTVADEAAADALLTAVLEARLAACVHLIPIRSRYWWEGRIEAAEEILLVFKTASAQVTALMEFIRARHAYTVPELTMIPIGDGDPAYLRWILRETAVRGEGQHE